MKLFPTFEYMDLTHAFRNILLHIVIVYKLPNTSFPSFATDLCALLEAVNICSGKLIILDDLNIHILDLFIT